MEGHVPTIYYYIVANSVIQCHIIYAGDRTRALYIDCDCVGLRDQRHIQFHICAYVHAAINYCFSL